MAPRTKKEDGTPDKPTMLGGPLMTVLLGTNGYRLALLIIVFSMHPVGRQVLGTFGFQFPDQRSLTVATDEAKTTSNKIDAVVEGVKELTKDVSSIKANNAILNDKVDRLDKSFAVIQTGKAATAPAP